MGGSLRGSSSVVGLTVRPAVQFIVACLQAAVVCLSLGLLDGKWKWWWQVEVIREGLGFSILNLIVCLKNI